jgi:hypothetical protein
MKEPKRIKLNTETPTPKEPTKHPLPPLVKPEWDVAGQDNMAVYTPLDLDKLNKILDESSDENTENCN